LNQKLLEEIRKVGSYKKFSPGPKTSNGQSEGQLSYAPYGLTEHLSYLREDDEGNELLLYFVEKAGYLCMDFPVHGDKNGIRAVAGNR